MVGSTPLLAAVVAFLTWPVSSLAPSSGIDPSWVAALHMAAEMRLDFGEDIVWTYGPAGFLRFPTLYSGPTAALAWIYVGAVHFVTCLALLWAARRLLPLAPALLLTVVLAKVPGDPVVAAFIGCFAFLALGDLGRNERRLLLVAGGVVSAFEGLGKLDSGVTVIGMCLVTVLLPAEDRRGNAIVYGATLAVTALAIWFATGQGVTNIPAYLVNALEISSGYSTAMGREQSGRGWEYVAAALLAAGFLQRTWATSREWERRRQVALLAASAILLFVSYKHSFVRHDANHAFGFFAVVAGAVLPLCGRTVQSRAATALVATAALVAFTPVTDVNWSQLIDPLERAERAPDQLGTLLSRDERAEHITANAAMMRQLYGIDPATLEALRGRSVHVWPQEAEVAWAYPGLDWEPLPVFQNYSAYTESLDEVNADFIRSEEGPERILRSGFDAAAIDGRSPRFDAPATRLALLCNYVEEVTTDRWMVLRRAPERCGPPRRLSTMAAEAGEPVRVPQPPRPDQLVFASVEGAGPSLLEKAQAALHKLGERRIVVNGASFRLVPETASGPLLMTVPEQADYSGPLALSPEARSIAVEGAGDIEVEFHAMPIESGRLP